MEATVAKESGLKSPIFRDIRRYFCEHCGICRSKKSIIKSHILTHHKDEVHAARIDKENSLKEAILKFQHTCKECGATFRKKAYLTQHMLCHSLERSFTCPVNNCFLSYRRKDHLNRHLLKHQGKLFKCPMKNCNKEFAFQGNMTRHVKEIHDDDDDHDYDDGGFPCKFEKQRVCQEPGCGKMFQYPSKLKKHEGSHVKLEITCGEPGCRKLFMNHESLKAHTESSHNKYVRCEVCGTRQLKKNLKRHRRTHERFAKQKLKCSFEGCEHTYCNKSNLDKHVKAIHEELRPFECRTSGCQMKFQYKHVRDKHAKTHLYEQGDFLEADERRSSRPRGGRKRRRIAVEALTRKRIVSLDSLSVLDDGIDYLRWLLPDGGEERVRLP